VLGYDPEALDAIFASTTIPLAVHAENELRLRERYQLYEGTTDPADHPLIRDVETALSATKQAVQLAQRHGARLHILHLSTAEEADYLATIPREEITCEVCPQHLLLDAETAYTRLGTKAQCNPPVRGSRHARTLWQRLLDGTIDCMATNHAPHTLDEKARPFPTSPSGMPNVEWHLPLMLHQVHQGRITLHELVRVMCEGPAKCYRIPRKGRLETGYDGDIVLVDLEARRTVEDGAVFTRCGWSPWAGETLQGWPVLTAVLGEPVFRDGQIVDGVRGRALTYQR
jgi:dihydroorotase